MSPVRPSAVALTVTPHQAGEVALQLLTVHLTAPDRLIEPQDLEGLTLPAGIDTTQGVMITGRAPIWLYAHLVHELHPTAWVGCYDPRLGGGVVVATHSRQARIGQVIPLPLGPATPRLGPALLVVGPPDSGKSVLSHGLLRSLLPHQPGVFLQRASWDGEGNWIFELPPQATEEQRQAFKLAYKGGPSDRFFSHQALGILQLRRQQSLVIVDVGGRVQPEKVPVVEACSHYLIISRDPAAIDPWHEFCRDRGNLQPLAVIHSTATEQLEIHRRQPYLEITCGPWLPGETPVPGVLLEWVQALGGRS